MLSKKIDWIKVRRRKTTMHYNSAFSAIMFDMFVLNWKATPSNTFYNFNVDFLCLTFVAFLNIRRDNADNLELLFFSFNFLRNFFYSLVVVHLNQWSSILFVSIFNFDFIRVIFNVVFRCMHLYYTYIPPCSAPNLRAH